MPIYDTEDEKQNIIITKMTKDIEYMKKDIGEIKQSIKDFDETLRIGLAQNQKEFLNALEELDKRKAGKWVERVMVGIGTAIGLTLLGAILSLIIK